MVTASMQSLLFVEATKRLGQHHIHGWGSDGSATGRCDSAREHDAAGASHRAIELQAALLAQVVVPVRCGKESSSR